MQQEDATMQIQTGAEGGKSILITKSNGETQRLALSTAGDVLTSTVQGPTTDAAAEPPQTAPTAQTAGGKNGVIIIPTDGPDPDISVRVDGEGIHVTQGESQTLIPIRDVVPRGAVQIAWAIPAALSILVIWWPLSRAVIRWINRKHVSNQEAAALEARLRDRFETLERNLDTVAVEMERLSEGQRFTNKLLAERAEKERVPVSGQG